MAASPIDSAITAAEYDLNKTATLTRLRRRIEILKASARYNVDQICEDLDKIFEDALEASQR